MITICDVLAEKRKDTGTLWYEPLIFMRDSTERLNGWLFKKTDIIPRIKMSKLLIKSKVMNDYKYQIVVVLELCHIMFK